MRDLMAEIDWNTLLQQPDAIGMLIGLGSMTIIILGVTIAVQWRKAQQARYNAELKERMIERGFTAEEIERVINAGTTQKRVGKRGAHVVDVCLPGRCEAPGGEAAKEDPMSC